MDLGINYGINYLEVLDPVGNNLSGEIPAELGNLVNLRDLMLDGNNLSGQIPWELGNLTNLRYLGLDGNDLSGEIPAELGNLVNLEDLALYNNNLSGQIPWELGNLVNLRRLVLSENNLWGQIPAELGNLINLEFLTLEWNKLRGEIPAELGNLVNLRGLHLRFNDFRGEIPGELGNLVNLRDLMLDYDLSGCIPSSLNGQLTTHLFELDRWEFCPDTGPPPVAPLPPQPKPRDPLAFAGWILDMPAEYISSGSVLLNPTDSWRGGGALSKWPPMTSENFIVEFSYEIIEAQEQAQEAQYLTFLVVGATKVTHPEVRAQMGLGDGGVLSYSIGFVRLKEYPEMIALGVELSGLPPCARGVATPSEMDIECETWAEERENLFDKLEMAPDDVIEEEFLAVAYFEEELRGVASEEEIEELLANASERGVSVTFLSEDLDLINSGVYEAEVVFDKGRIEFYVSNPEQDVERTLLLSHTIADFVHFENYALELSADRWAPDLEVSDTQYLIHRVHLAKGSGAGEAPARPTPPPKTPTPAPTPKTPTPEPAPTVPPAPPTATPPAMPEPAPPPDPVKGDDRAALIALYNATGVTSGSTTTTGIPTPPWARGTA